MNDAVEDRATEAGEKADSSTSSGSSSSLQLRASSSRASSAPWTHSQRVVLLVLLSILALYLGTRLLLNPMYVSDPQPLHPPHEQDLKNRIDPNTADVKTLAALPMIGEKRAREIVAYRERVAAERPGEIAYNRVEDLLRIKGIGRAMVQTIEPFLYFQKTLGATTRPR